jgi:hypothetical protein
MPLPSIDIPKIPSTYNVTTDSNLTSNSTVGMTTNSVVDLDMGLDNINTTSNLTSDSKVDMGLDNINTSLTSDSKVDMGLDNVNICINMGVSELPKMKFHMPMNYDFGIDIFGMRVMNFCLGGKSMLISEDNPTQVFYNSQQRQGTDGARAADSGVTVSLKD